MTRTIGEGIKVVKAVKISSAFFICAIFFCIREKSEKYSFRQGKFDFVNNAVGIKSAAKNKRQRSGQE